MAEQASDEQKLADWCRAIKGFVCKGAPSEIVEPVEEAIAKALKRKNLKGLQRIAKDLAAWAGTLPADLQKEMNAVLRARFGKSLNDVGDEEWKALRRVVARGRIEGEDEYELVMKRVEEIYADNAAQKELESLNGLLREHDKQHVR